MSYSGTGGQKYDIAVCSDEKMSPWTLNLKSIGRKRKMANHLTLVAVTLNAYRFIHYVFNANFK